MSCDAAGTVAAIRAVAATVAEHKVELTHLDREIGDGDHGENLARGFTAVLTKLDAGRTRAGDTRRGAQTGCHHADLDRRWGGRAAVRHRLPAGGDLGRRLRRHWMRRRWSTALTAARDGVVARGKAESGDKTMVDALTPAVTRPRPRPRAAAMSRRC